MYLSRLRLKNIRRFKDAELTATAKPGRCLLLIGRNGTCKTSVLRCLAIGLAQEPEVNKLLGADIGRLRQDPEQPGEIEVELRATGGEVHTVTTSIIGSREREQLAGRESTIPDEGLRLNSFVCGYGTSRSLVGDTSGGRLLSHAVDSLFHHDSRLVHPELAIRRLRDFHGTKLFKSTMSSLQRAAGFAQSDEIRVARGGGLTVHSKSLGTIPLEGLADGLRMPLNLLLDIYMKAFLAKHIDENGHPRGILMIDEIEQHLHPALQRDVIQRYRRLLPQLQIIATTHSPLVTLGAKPEDVAVLRAGHKWVTIDQTLPDFTMYSADDILEDPELFDTAPYEPVIEERVQQYREIAAIPVEKRTSAQTKQMQTIAQDMQATGSPVVSGRRPKNVAAKEADDPVMKLVKKMERKYGL